MHMLFRTTLLLGTLCLTGLCSPNAQAQEILNELLPQAFTQAKAAHVVVPDSTTPWRYFPLQIGNVWEYQDFRGLVLRMTIVRDSTFDGHHYFQLDYRGYGRGPAYAQFSHYDFYLRYDTTEQRARENHPNVEDERVYFYTPCPLNAPFDEIADCTPESSWYASGRYDGVLVFGGERPGEGSDTLRTPVKAFTLIGLERRFAAGIGLVYHSVEGHGWGLVYARIDGVEYGERRITVAREPDALAASGLRIERAYPNPVHTQFHLDYTAAQPAPLAVSLFDVLGRRVVEEAVSSMGSGTASLDVSALAPGIYFARLCNPNACVSQPVVKTR